MLFLCLKIFFVRILDVSLGTIRTIVTVKGKAFIASLIGFIEVLIWFIVVKEALNTDIESIWIAVSYSLGYATGTLLGSYLSNVVIKGNLGIKIITSNKNKSLIKAIRNAGYAVSVVEAKGKDNKQTKYMLFMEINKKKLNHLKELVESIDENAFFVVNETSYVQNGYIK